MVAKLEKSIERCELRVLLCLEIIPKPSIQEYFSFEVHRQPCVIGLKEVNNSYQVFLITGMLEQFLNKEIENSIRLVELLHFKNFLLAESYQIV